MDMYSERICIVYGYVFWCIWICILVYMDMYLKLASKRKAYALPKANEPIFTTQKGIYMYLYMICYMICILTPACRCVTSRDSTDVWSMPPEVCCTRPEVR